MRNAPILCLPGRQSSWELGREGALCLGLHPIGWRVFVFLSWPGEGLNESWCKCYWPLFIFLNCNSTEEWICGAPRAFTYQKWNWQRFPQDSTGLCTKVIISYETKDSFNSSCSVAVPFPALSLMRLHT